MSDAFQSFVAASLEDLTRRGIQKRLRISQSAAGASVKVGNRSCIQLSSNNYLGLTTHPKVCAAAAEALREFGTGSGAVMPISGAMTVHEECEQALASFKATEAAMLMPSGYTANVGTVAALMGPGDLVISDELNHASIIDGIRLSGAEKRIYPHSDIEALERILQETAGFGKRLIVTDGVFSMDGDIAPLPAIVELKDRYGATLMLDDAHATGVLGEHGGGTAEHFGLSGKVDIQIGTLSKALAAVGGFVASSRGVIDLLRQKSRPFLFSCSLPPSVAASITAAIAVIATEPDHRKRLWENATYFRHGLMALGFNTGSSQTPITPVIIGDSSRAAAMSERLELEGVLASEILFPMVSEKLARIRTIVSAAHSRQQLESALAAFAKVGRELKIID